jgi:hypothetical protein
MNLRIYLKMMEYRTEDKEESRGKRRGKGDR